MRRRLRDNYETMYNNHSLADYRDRQWQQKYTYRLGYHIVAFTAAWGRLVTFVFMFAMIPLFVLTAVLRKHKLIGILAAIIPVATQVWS
jgi:hypothetical protein